MWEERYFRKALAAAVVLCCCAICSPAQSQSAPVPSGAAGVIGTNDNGVPSWQPVIAPVVLAPVGDHILIESRADFRGFLGRSNGSTGPYQGQFFGTLEYLQLDYTFSRSITFVAGRFLTPFGIYNERFTALWIRNLPQAPLIFPIGTRTSGSSNGAMLRTSIGGHGDWQLNVTAFSSGGTRTSHLESGRAAGTRVDVLFPTRALELGASYERYLEGTHSNAVGAHLSWTPDQAKLQLRSEYAHSISGQGYWAEAAFLGPGARKPNSILGRLQPVLRLQQFYRTMPQFNDSLPATDTTQADLGLNYFVTHDVRISSSFGQQFTAARDHHVWSVALTYRFVLPIPIGGK